MPLPREKNQLPIHNVQTQADALSDEVQSNRLAAARNDIEGILEIRMKRATT